MGKETRTILGRGPDDLPRSLLLDDLGRLIVSPSSGVPSTLYDGTQLVGAAAALNSGTSLSCVEMTIQADPDNNAHIFVGNATSQSVQLAPGQSETFSLDDVAKVYARSASGNQRVNWHAVA